MMMEEMGSLHEAIQRGDTDRIEQLLNSKELDVNKDFNFLSPLGRAAESRQTDIAALLLDRGCDVNLGDRRLKTPLYIASRTGNLDLTKLLLKHHPKLELKHVNGNTPLHEAVVRGHTDIVRVLIQAGSDVTSVNNGKETPLHISCLKGFTEITQMLIAAGSDVCARKGKLGVEPIHLAAYGGHKDILKILMNAGVDINTAKQDNGRTPLHIAAIHSSAEFVEALIELGCDLNSISSENEEAKTPLLKAVELGHVEITRKLVAAGADTNIGDRWSVTPLLTVMLQGQVTLAKILIQAGCDVNRASRNGLTPFTASLRNTADLTMFLVEANCRPTFTDREHLARAVELAADTERWNLLTEIQRILCHPRPLLHICRESIRNSVGQGCCHKLDSLGLPRNMMNYLKYQHL